MSDKSEEVIDWEEEMNRADKGEEVTGNETGVFPFFGGGGSAFDVILSEISAFSNILRLFLKLNVFSSASAWQLFRPSVPAIVAGQSDGDGNAICHL